MNNKKLSFWEKAAYGSAGIGDGTSYTLLATFLLFFLTTIVGIKPALAGTIVAIGSIWDVMCSPLVGYLSDNCRSSIGRRRPFIACGTLPLAIATSLLFTSVDAGMTFRVIYYMVMIILFWSSFSFFFVPYLALGAEITTDYDERTVLRSYTSVCNSIGNVLGAVFPSMMVDILCSHGKNLAAAWQVTGIIIGVLAGFAVLLTFLGSKGKDKSFAEWEKTLGYKVEVHKFSFRQLFKDYFEILKLKPMQILVAVSVITLTGLTIFTSDRLYYFTYNLGMNAKEISFILLWVCLAGFLAPVVINLLTKVMDKKKTFITVMGSYAILIFLFKFIPVDGMGMLMVLMLIFGVCYMSYWQLLPTMLYDVCEYDEYYNKRQRGGTLMSLQSLAEALAEAIGVQLLGIILQVAGFVGEAEVQSAHAMLWIENCLVIVPSALIIIACILVSRYPITKEKFMEIQEALKIRRGE